MDCVRITCRSPEEVRVLGDVLLHPDVFGYLRSDLRSLSGLVRLIDQLRCEAAYCFALFAGDRATGLCWGHEFEPGVLLGHQAFVRHGDAFQGMRLALAAYEKATGIHRFCGLIPDTFRAAKLVAMRSGFKDRGLRPDVLFDAADGRRLVCREFRRE